MSIYFNDSPIEKQADDQYGITPFAKALATSIIKLEKPIGTTIAINGPWGSGKSSAVNLIRSELDTIKSDKLDIIDFKCWWYRGEEAIALAFLQELNTALKPALGDKLKNAIPDIGRHILQAGPVIGAAVSLATTSGIGALVSGGASFIKRFFPDKDSLEKTFKKISKVLEEQNHRFLIVIDDIDRLSPDESIAIFRLVKSVGRLPNVIYLLVFDRKLADAAVQERYPSEGPHFLEKIIQASFELPSPLQSDLNNAILSATQDICGPPQDQYAVRFMNLFYDCVAPYIETPRHVTRFINSINVTWPAIKNEISLADYIALETIRLYEPKLFSNIRNNRELATRTNNHEQTQSMDSKYEPFLKDIPENKHGAIRIILQRLFPILEDVSYSGGFQEIWDIERRVCLSKHFDTYFRTTLSDESIPISELNNCIAHANDINFIQQYLRKASNEIRKNGSSMVPVVLDELTSHATRIDREKVTNFLSAIFSIVDEITRPEDDEHGFVIGNTHLRVHWLIRRVTADRFNLEEKTALYLKATERASMGWLVDFVSSAVNDYNKEEGREIDLSTCLVSENVLPDLKRRAVDSLKKAAELGELLRKSDLMFNLYRWRDFSDNNGSEMREWLSNVMKDDKSLVLITRSLTGESWSFGIGGYGSLGDRVSHRNTTVRIGKDFDLFDKDTFKTNLNRILHDKQLPKSDLETVENFLEAWSKARDQ